MPKRSHSRQASITARKPPSLIALRLTPPRRAGDAARCRRANGCLRRRRSLSRRGGDPRHGIELVRLDRLLEKIEAATVDQPQVIEAASAAKP